MLISDFCPVPQFLTEVGSFRIDYRLKAWIDPRGTVHDFNPAAHHVDWLRFEGDPPNDPDTQQTDTEIEADNTLFFDTMRQGWIRVAVTHHIGAYEVEATFEEGHVSGRSLRSLMDLIDGYGEKVARVILDDGQGSRFLSVYEALNVVRAMMKAGRHQSPARARHAVAPSHKTGNDMATIPF